jgi:ubiquinone/menaquinone biosynthesis C-methylase UbiE
VQRKENIIDCYDSTAEEYAGAFLNELSKKPFDRMILEKFAEENMNKYVIDLGCGPGQTTRFLRDRGIKKILGVDISPSMVNTAALNNKGIKFETGDMLKLDYGDNTFGSAVAFYSIVHFTYYQISKAFREINRVLKSKGQLLLSFHTGKEKVHLNSFFDKKVNIDFYYFETEKIMKLLKTEGFKIVTAAERFPYPDSEHQSKRAYILAVKADRK